MGELAASWTRGFQNGRGKNETKGFLQGILTLKHYVANSLENTLVPEDVTLGAQIGIGSFGVSHEHACVYLPRHADSQDDQYRHTISCCRRWSTKRSGMARKLPRKLPIRS